MQSLLARAIKHEERKKNIAGARELLARLKHVGIDKVGRAQTDRQTATTLLLRPPQGG